MEYGSTLGTYLAYAVILLVLLVMAAAFLRALLMPAAIVLLHVARRLGGNRTRSSAPDSNAESHKTD
jgi:hypothetical protein